MPPTDPLRDVLRAVRVLLTALYGPGASGKRVVIDYDDRGPNRLILPISPNGEGPVEAPPQGKPAAAPAPRRAADYKLDKVEVKILLALARSYPQPLTMEELMAATGVSRGTLAYKGRIKRLQELGLIVNDGDHQGYRLTEEDGERVAGELEAEEGDGDQGGTGRK